jgi:hypothetical protein
MDLLQNGEPQSWEAPGLGSVGLMFSPAVIAGDARGTCSRSAAPDNPVTDIVCPAFSSARSSRIMCSASSVVRNTAVIGASVGPLLIWRTPRPRPSRVVRIRCQPRSWRIRPGISPRRGGFPERRYYGRQCGCRLNVPSKPTQVMPLVGERGRAEESRPHSFCVATSPIHQSGSHARDFLQLPLCDLDRPNRHLVFLGVW